MKKSPFVLRILCLGALLFGMRFAGEWVFSARIAASLALIATFYALLAKGSGRSYMKTLHGRLETSGAAFMLVGIAGLMGLVILSGSEFIGPIAAIPGALYLLGLLASLVGVVA